MQLEAGANSRGPISSLSRACVPRLSLSLAAQLATRMKEMRHVARTIVIARWSEARAPAFFDSDDLSSLPRSTIAATMLHAAVSSRGKRARSRARARALLSSLARVRPRRCERACWTRATGYSFARRSLRSRLEATATRQANQKQAQLEAAARVSRLTQLWDMRLEQSATAGIASPRILSRLRPGAASASAPGVDQAPADASHNAPGAVAPAATAREARDARDDAEKARSLAAGASGPGSTPAKRERLRLAGVFRRRRD